ncbi:MAG: hypothetical protein FLDDKLPJ_01807 [Phycisphaerae bacterium]|nr:hypothetical protein [Phycisphaerae bacterium]
MRTQRETVSLGGDAFEIVVEILGEIGDPAAIDSLLPHVDSRFAETRKCVGLALGSIGHLDGLRGLKRLLDDEDAYVRSHVLIGIDRGINSHRATPALLDGLRESLMRLLEIKDTGFESKPAELLLHLDRGWALTVLLGDRVLRADNPNVVGILRSLRKTNVILPARALERLDLEFDALPDGYQKEYGKGQMLLARAAARLPDAEEKAQAAVSSQSREIRNGAADALAWLAGVENPIEFVESREREVGWEGLTQPQRNFSAVWMLEAEVNNGGFSQYFFNSWSDHWPDALTGLNAIGARRTAEILQRAVAVFGPEGPATDREARMDQLSKLIDRCEKELDDLDDQFYKETDPLYVQYMLYAAKHADQFGGLSRLT